MTPDQEMQEAWARVLSDRGLPGDGMRVTLWLRRVQLNVLPMGAPTCAVHDSEGQRRLASQILGFAPGTDDVDRERTDARSDLALRRASRDASAGQSRARGANRRVPV